MNKYVKGALIFVGGAVSGLVVGHKATLKLMQSIIKSESFREKMLKECEEKLGPELEHMFNEIAKEVVANVQDVEVKGEAENLDDWLL